jgi:DNA-binding NtrC family response regulator
VLLLDDDVDLLDALDAVIVSLSGRRTWVAHSVAELSDLDGRALECGLALLDINLGAGAPSGLDALAWLRRNEFPGVVCFLTGHARGFPPVDQAYRMGDVRVLTKPLSVDHLKSLLEEVP